MSLLRSKNDEMRPPRSGRANGFKIPSRLIGGKFGFKSRECSDLVSYAPMLTYLRYALATVCFAASIGCLALWRRSITYHEMSLGPDFFDSNKAVGFTAGGPDTRPETVF